MKTYTDNSILQATELDFKQVIYTLPQGYKELREPSHIVEHEGKFIWIMTFVKEIGGEDVHSLHRIECDVNDITNWEYKGQLNLRNGAGNVVEAEDATFCFGTDGKIHLYVEDKSYEKGFAMFVISKFIANDWKSTFYFQGGDTTIQPIAGQDAAYSALFTGNEKELLIHDMRKGVHKEEVYIADYNGSYHVTRPNPILTIDDFPIPVSTTGIADNIHELPNCYLMEIVSHINGVGWMQGFATCDTLDGHYSVLNTNITKKGTNQSTMFHLFYTDRWMALASTIDNSNNIYLAEVITDGSKPKPNGENMKPQRLLFDGKVLSCDDIPTASRFDAYATGGFQFDLISSEFNRFNNRVNFMNIADKFIKGKGQEFWIVAEVNGVKYTSDHLKFGEPEFRPFNTEYVEAIKAEMVKINNGLSKIHSNLNKIE